MSHTLGRCGAHTGPGRRVADTVHYGTNMQGGRGVESTIEPPIDQDVSQAQAEGPCLSSGSGIGG